ncbi:MAG: BTAD domain-containing putative transcriptional regulator [Micromonosporaceae bacterium]
MTAGMEFRVLGPIQARQRGRWVQIGGTRQRTVLAALLFARSAGVPNPRLERLLWGDAPPDTSHAQILTYIYKLRKLLYPDADVARQGAGYVLRIGPENLDLSVFERRADHARRALSNGHAGEAAAELRVALALWRGPVLADVTDHLKRIEQPRLEELRLAALEDRIDADLIMKQEIKLVPELMGLVAEYPLRERLRGQLMLALHRSGRRADALGVYREGRRILVEETGLELGDRLRRIHDAILAGDQASPPTAEWLASSGESVNAVMIEPPAAIEDEVRVWTDGRRPAQLPPLGPALVGRDKEIAAVMNALQPGSGREGPSAVPVCAITGMAGVGKTALAVHVAHRLRDRYPHGHLHADLRGLDARPARPDEVLGRFLQALGAQGATAGGMEECLALYRSLVADRRILLVLDNASSERQVRPLLPAGARCAVVITSRSRLPGLDGADAIDLNVLEPHHAVDLIARIAGPQRVAAEPDAAERIARLCGSLPLGVRIAGARLAAHPHWPLSRLANRLADERRLLDELQHDDMDVRGSVMLSCRDLPAATVQALHLLAQLDVPRFASWMVTALLAVPIQTAEDLLDMLVDARLLEVAEPRHAPCGYYRFHELVRRVAREIGGREETVAARRAALRHAFRAWLALAGEAHRRLAGQGLEMIRCARSRLPDDVTIDALLADPLAWFESERSVLSAVLAQARAERQHVVASELAVVLGRLELAGNRGVCA